jgi:hypothetical protein
MLDRVGPDLAHLSRIEWNGIEGPLGSPELILPAGSLLDVVGRMRSATSSAPCAPAAQPCERAH